MTMTCEIPVWVNGVEKWVTGVGRRTTCAELVRALLTTERPGQPPSDDELRTFTIVERWREVERPLDAGARIQKVWRSWADDTAQVRFTLKRLGPLTPRELKALRRRHHSRHRWRGSGSLEAVHPRKLAAEPAAAGRQDVVERLMQTILVQGETIAAQLRRLHEREDLIGYYEHKMHRMREDELGSDYLLRTYLRDGEPTATDPVGRAGAGAASGSGGCAGEPPPDVSEEEAVSDLRHTLHYLERVVELNHRIAEQEEAALRLSHMTRRAAAAPVDDQLAAARSELAQLAAVCARQTAEIERNQRALAECERLIEERRRHVQQLEHELDLVDGETSRLLAEQLAVAEPPAPAAAEARWTPHGAHKDLGTGDADSNSDTGLSSLHSSSDEAAVGYVLDTLV